MKIKELLITNEEQDGNNVILTLESGEKVIMLNGEYESMITSGLDEMLGDMFPESHAKWWLQLRTDMVKELQIAQNKKTALAVGRK